ncbi:hypothetical protein REPUB_Repub08aG0192000 [Reevesia pubescens]
MKLPVRNTMALVGASTIDRKVVATAKLGNGEEFDGESVFQPNDFPSMLLPLVYADMNGGAAMILMNDEANGFSLEADAHVLAATHVSYSAGLKIKAYINSTAAPTVTILFGGTIIGNLASPSVASFSSRGPSLASPGILKPDIIGPGVNILAAWPFPLNNNTNSKSTFNIMSGTSKSCLHLSGIAALLKSSHPTWSPAAIKSAMMTSTDLFNIGGKHIVDETLQPADVFATGAGHVNPSRADNPGLIYDIQPDDYIPYLCGLGYKDNEVGILAHRPIKCLEKPSIPEGELNYRSFSVKLGPSQIYTRTVTNVGEANSSYEVMVIAPNGVDVSVKPSTLYFSELNQKANYSITSTRIESASKIGEFSRGYIKWVSAKYFVRSPISVRFE